MSSAYPAGVNQTPGQVEGTVGDAPRVFDGAARHERLTRESDPDGMIAQRNAGSGDIAA